MSRRITIQCFSQGKFEVPVGDLCPDDDDDITLFVQDVFNGFHLNSIPIASASCYVFKESMLVRVRSTGYLQDMEKLYVCPVLETSDLQKELRKLEKVAALKEKKEKIFQSIQQQGKDGNDLNKEEKGRTSMGKTTLQRLEYHFENWDNPDYTK